MVAMGKLGGRELNVSSDIDLVLVHPGGLEAQERYEQAGRRLIRVLAGVTEDGFVFRVDMRLRPYGDSGPLACSFDFLETYFVTQGREWERYAWIKARADGAESSRHEGALAAGAAVRVPQVPGLRHARRHAPAARRGAAATWRGASSPTT